MAVISITITPSTDQTIPGIPNSVSIETNEPATVFYTLDGTPPNTYSPIYTVPIQIPAAKLIVTLNVFATNGIDSSAIITTEYTGNISTMTTTVGDRVPHATVAGQTASLVSNNLFPFGGPGVNVPAQYLSAADAGSTVYNQALPATPFGYDWRGNPDGYTNQPLSDFEFDQRYSTTSYEGLVFPGAGNLPDSNSTVVPPVNVPFGQEVKSTTQFPGTINLPGNTMIIGSSTPLEFSQEVSSTSDKIFNPRAMVIYQDSTTEDPTNPVLINRQFFSLENQEVVRDGALLYNTAMETPTTMGSFINSFYNSRTNMLTSYFYDNAYQKWIISSAPYQPTNKHAGQLYNMVPSRPQTTSAGERGVGQVFVWVEFTRRVLM